MKKKEKSPLFVYGGTESIDPHQYMHLLDLNALEKKRIRQNILPQIKDLKKEISKKNRISDRLKKIRFNKLLKDKLYYRNRKVQYENGEIYPREIDAPDIRYIQIPEPYKLVGEWDDNYLPWHDMPELIKTFSEEAYLCYNFGFWLSSIASAINCSEYILKYEYLRFFNKKDRSSTFKLSLDKHFSLGSFTNKSNKYLNELRIKNKFLDKLLYLNDLRVSLFHSSFERASKVNKKGKLEVEKFGKLDDFSMQPIIAYRAYTIMMDLINHFYSKKKAVEYLEEGLHHWMKINKVRDEDLKNED